MTRRKKMDSNQSRHETQCSVCKHPQRLEIERRYMAFETGAHVAREFGVSESSICRHAQYFGLDSRRVSDTENVLKSLIAHGLNQLKKVDGRLLIEAIKELNKITGKHQAARENDADRERKRLQYERAVERFLQEKAERGEPCDRAQAIGVLAAIEPEINDYVH